MTQNKKRKRKIHALADKTGMSYTAARRVLLSGTLPSGASLQPPATLPVSRVPTIPAHLVPASALDYVRACTLASRIFDLLVNTSELAWQIYGVSSPQGRDGDKITSKGQYVKNLLRADALDEGVPKGVWQKEKAIEKIFRRYYPAPKWLSQDINDPDQILYRGRGPRARCPKSMPAEAHRAVAQAHREAVDSLQQLEALLAPHYPHPGTRLRLNACRRLVELARRQQAAFQTALQAEHGAAASLPA